MMGSLKTDSRVLLVVRVVREAREGGDGVRNGVGGDNVA